jgi:hypothetical protein
VKRFAALALAGSIQLTALAGNPVSVYPPAPAKPASSMSQPLSAAVQSAAVALPAAPAPTMTSTPSWGTPTVLPGTPGGTLPASGIPCGDPAAGQVVKPYFNPLALRTGCDAVRGSCLDRLKDWFNYRPTPGSFPCSPTPYRAPMRAYFPCKPTCGSGGCGTGGGNCGTVAMPVRKLEAGCDTPATCRPRVMYQPLTARSEVPAVGCDARPVRPQLFDRLLGLFTPKCAAACAEATCPSNDWTPAAAPAATVWNTPNPSGVVPTPTPGTLVPPMSTTPVYGPTPTGTKLNAKPIQLSPAQPFTNP